MTSKRQIPTPQEVQRRLRLRVGDRVVSDLVALAGTLGGRQRRKARPWQEIRDAAWAEETRRRA